MKELSIEEKAKAYDEALERAKNLHKDAITLQLEQDIKDYEYIFPELKESEDERIRKELIEHIKANRTADYILFKKFSSDDVIAWLEKQGESYTQRDVDNAYIEGMAFAKHELEKQGEQKPVNDTDEDIVEAVKDTSILDVVEPKFKVGDWIVYNRDDYSREIIQVYDIRDGRYYFTDNVHFSWSIKECDEKSHLWTIQDAKEGDVLVDVYENIGIYQQHDDFDWTSYCSLGFHGGFQNFKVEHENDKTHPATKEQRDQLEKAMNEAGYEWDAEKKKLSKRVIDEGKSEMDYCFTKMMNSEKVNPTWSEEDDEILRTIISDGIRGAEFDMLQINWLKSLKERIGG